MPNPWGEDVKGGRRNEPLEIGLLRGHVAVAPYLIGFAGINATFSVLSLLILTATPWSQLDWLHQWESGFAFAFGCAEVILVLRSDVNSRIWQGLTAVVVCLNLVWYGLMLRLDR